MREMQGWLSMEGKGIVQGQLRLLQEFLRHLLRLAIGQLEIDFALGNTGKCS